MLSIIFLAVVYQLLQIILLPLIIVFLLIHHYRRKSFRDLPERLGFIPRVKAHQNVIWVHAVSVGEVLSTQVLIDDIKKNIPGAACYLTVGSVAGKKIAKSHIKADYISYLPYDLFPCMLMAHHRIKPKALIIIEAELWPNLILFARLKAIPLFLMNARINPKSVRKFMAFRWFFKTLNSCFTAIFTQAAHDKELLHKIGVNNHSVKVLGNLKAFNVVAKKNEHLEKLDHIPAPLPEYTTLFVGSVHPGEIELYLKMFTELKKTTSNLKLILAPRHFTWRDKLIELVSKTGYPFFEWTEQNSLAITPENPYPSALQKLFSAHDVLLVCKLGELFNLYPYTDIYFLGGTFVPIGGHNLLESIAWGVPTVIGPQHHNSQDIADRLTIINGVVKATDYDDLLSKTKALVHEQALRKDIGLKSYEWVCHEAKSVEKIVNSLIQDLLKVIR